MFEQPVLISIGGVAAFAGALGIGYKISEFFHRHRNGKHVLREDCDARYDALHKKATYTKYLLMEITTPEQQHSAKVKADTFDD